MLIEKVQTLHLMVYCKYKLHTEKLTEITCGVVTENLRTVLLEIVGLINVLNFTHQMTIEIHSSKYTPRYGCQEHC